MTKATNLTLSRDDFQKISYLLEDIDTETSELLLEEINRATIVETEDLPDDVVAMNSSVRFIDETNNKEFLMTLVYPQEAKIEMQKISILSPIGSALIGLKMGQSIDWPMPTGDIKTLKVIKVDKPLSK
jgi:regulator of nucleoside diphosphate kinase